MIEKSKWNIEAWNVLLVHAQTASIESSRNVFESFLKVFPTSSRYWKIYAEREIKAENYDRCEDIFSRCLKTNLDADLWNLYLNYMKMIKDQSPDRFEVLTKSYEFALKHMGNDHNAGSIYTAYIRFLHSATEIEDSDKINILRKVYQKAVVAPIKNLESLWSEYERWEHNLGATLAKKIIVGDLQTRHFAAKQSARERKKLRSGMLIQLSARPPSEDTLSRDYQQVALWRNYLRYEQSNPQRLEPIPFKLRVLFAFKQALLVLRQYPDVWYEYMEWCLDNNHEAEAEKVMEEAVEALPDSLLMQLIYAQYLEQRNQINQALQVYQTLVEVQEERRQGANPLAYVQYMRFARRCFGITMARRVFVQARRSKGVSHVTYCAAAQLEAKINKENKLAAKIYIMALELYSGEIEFIKQYLEFLSATHDHNNKRVVFERVFKEATIDSGEIRKLWDQFIETEREQGDLDTMTLVEARRREMLGYTESKVAVLFTVNDLVERFKFLDQWPCSSPYKQYLEQAVSTARFNTTPISQSSKKSQKSTKNKKNMIKPELSAMLPLKHYMTVDNPSPPPLMKNGARVPDCIAKLHFFLPNHQTYNGRVYPVQNLMNQLSNIVPPKPSTSKASERNDQNLAKKSSTSSRRHTQSSNLYMQRRKERMDRQSY